MCIRDSVNAYGLYNPTTKKGDVIPLDKNGKLAKSKADTCILYTYSFYYGDRVYKWLCYTFI